MTFSFFLLVLLANVIGQALGVGVVLMARKSYRELRRQFREAQMHT